MASVSFRLLSLVWLGALLTGCAAGEKGTAMLKVAGSQEDEAMAEQIAADPVAFLRKVHERCAAFDQYELVFYRQERLGLGGELGVMEEIHAKFRAEPFSVKFEWEDPESDYYESVYVEGENDNKLVVRERQGMKVGFIRLKPQIRPVNVKDPVIWGKAKNPVTDFGMARLLERTLLRYEQPDISPDVRTSCEGIAVIAVTDRKAWHIRIDLPPIKGVATDIQDLYIDTETLLPAGADLWLEDGRLDARYRYTQVDTDVNFTDADFRLSEDPPGESPSE